MERKPVHTERRLEQTISVLFEIANAVSQTRTLTEFYREIHRALNTLLPAENFFIAVQEPSQKNLRFPYVMDRHGRDPGEEAGAGFIREVLRSRSPRRFSDNQAPGRHPCDWMGVPLMIGERVIGVMGILADTQKTGYGPEALDLLNAVSGHVALAIERKEAENRIPEQGQILEQILESSPVGIALVQDRVFKWVNTEMVQMFGYKSKSDFQDQSVKMIYGAEEDFEFAGKTIYQGLHTRGKADYEMDLMRADRSRFPVHIRLNSTGGEDPMSWTIGTFTDISQRRAAEKEGVERERLQGVLEMAGAVCHEINQPLQAIIGYSELLELETDPARNRSSVRAIKSQATRLGKITATLANITQYKTVEYPGKNKIVDIWGASPRGGRFSH